MATAVSQDDRRAAVSAELPAVGFPETAVWHGSWGLQRPLWETAWQFLKRLNPELAHNSAGPLRSLHPRDLQTSVHMDSRTRVLSSVVQKYSQKLETTQMPIS